MVIVRPKRRMIVGNWLDRHGLKVVVACFVLAAVMKVVAGILKAQGL